MIIFFKRWWWKRRSNHHFTQMLKHARKKQTFTSRLHAKKMQEYDLLLTP